jgi:two-component system cell cycle response regulator
MNAGPQAPTKLKALIVDDESTTLDLLERIVAQHGYETQAFQDPLKAWQHFQEQDPHLVILDWTMPKMDGLEFTKKIRASQHGKYATILMISGRNTPEDMAVAIQAGVDYYAPKPFERSSFDIWLKMAAIGVNASQERKKNDTKLLSYTQELEGYEEQLEEAIGRANLLTMESELAYIEINQIFKTVAGGIVLVDKQCKVLRCNESFLEFAEAERKDTPDKKCYEIFHSCLCNSPECPLKRISAGEKKVETEIEKKHSSGAINYFHVVATPFKGPGGDLLGIVEHIIDITARVKAEKALKESEERYRELSIVDELTGLYNKRYFNKHLQMEVDRAKRYQHPLSLLLMDIDNFKHHNDTYGHADGDKVLARLGRVIASSIRTNDVACRYGGEEFTLILPVTSGKDAVVVGERIRKAFAAEAFYPVPGQKVQKTVSIGIAEYRKDEEGGSLLERTDANMYEAKKSGKNRYVFK